MLPVFPKAEDFCTKMPVRVSMQHKPSGPSECQIAFDGSPHGLSDVDLQVDLEKEVTPSKTILKVCIPASALCCMKLGSSPEHRLLSCASAAFAASMPQVMNQIHDEYAEQLGMPKCVVPHELVINIASPDVPTLEIVDLPGIREAPEDLRAATKELAYEYARKPEFILLCVVPATSQRLQSSQAMGIVQELGRAERTVCVLTKCDEVNVSKSTQLQRLTHRIKQQESDFGNELAAIVGVKNRDTVEEEEEEKENMQGEERKGKAHRPRHVRRRAGVVCVPRLVRQAEGWGGVGADGCPAVRGVQRSLGFCCPSQRRRRGSNALCRA